MRKLTRYLVVLLLVFSLVSVMAACGQNGQEEEPGTTGEETPPEEETAQVIYDWLTDDPGTFDAQEDTSLAVYEMARNLFSTLLRYKGSTLDLEPELVTAMPTVSDDGLVYSFELRDGIMLHDGETQLTANDVKFTIERMLDPNGRGASNWLFVPIKGAGAFADGEATSVEGINVIDDLHFDITLEEPYSPFLTNLAVPSASIYSEKLVTEAGEDWSQNPVGTGPFVLKSYTPDAEIVFARNPDYFEAGVPKVDEVNIRILPDEATGLLEFENGTLDISSIPTADFDRINDSGLYDIIRNEALNTYYLMFNMAEDQFQDIRVRKAIAMAIDKETIVEALYGGRASVAYAFTTPGIPGAFPSGTGPALPYDPEEAAALVKEAGAEGQKITIWQAGGDKVSDTNMAIQEMLADIGLELEVVIRDRSTYFEQRYDGLVPGNQGNWWADIPDPDNYLYTFFHSSSGIHYSTGYNNPEVDALLEEARVIADQAERARLYQEAEEIIIAQDVAVVPLYHTLQFRAVQPNLKGVVMSQTGLVSYREAYKEDK